VASNPIDTEQSAAAPSDGGTYQRAREVAEVAATYANATEALGYVHPNVLAVMQDRGLPQMLKPGSQHTIRDFVHVCGLLAEGCMSTGWCNFVWGMHNYLIGLYPQAVQDEVWRDPATLVSASLGPAGQVDLTDEGGILTGRWRFNSGCDHADWLLLGAGSETGEPQLALVHRCEYELIDTWQVIGLKGTGSKDAQCNQADIPASRLLPVSQVLQPYTALLVLVIVGPVVGGAQSAVDRFAAQLSQRHAAASGKPLADEQGMLLRLAEASAEVDAARTVTLAAADLLDANPAPDDRITARILRDTSYVAQLCNQATQRLFAVAGGSALHESNDLQRIFRDVTAGCAHARLQWDIHATPYARQLIEEAASR
jgi:3-hydroxy-9,10-secoandrosta-1,3,5(10)-triene-9,17-dione monooxygenase